MKNQLTVSFFLLFLLSMILFGCNNIEYNNISSELYANPPQNAQTTPTYVKPPQNAQPTPTYVKPAYPKMALSKYDTAYIDKDGILWGWGLNEDGLLGLGNSNEQLTPQVIDSDVRTVSIADMQGNKSGSDPHAALFYIKNDNTLWASGYNVHGELGVTTENRLQKPVQIMDDVDRIFIESGSALAEIYVLKVDSSLYYWQKNYEKDSFTITPTHVMNDVRWVIPDGLSTFFLLKTNELYIFKPVDVFFGVPGIAYAEKPLVPEKKLDGIRYAARSFHMGLLVLREDGTLLIQSDLYSNDNNELIEYLQNIVNCEVFLDTAVAIDKTGKLYAFKIYEPALQAEPLCTNAIKFAINRWGELSSPNNLYILDEQGQVFAYNTEESIRRINLTNVIDIYAEESRAYFLRENGELWVIGEFGDISVGEHNENASVREPSIVLFD